MTIVRTILDLGANLDLAVVAEGIESARTRRLLLDLGCSLAQGYELGRPVPAQALTDALCQGRTPDESLRPVAA